MIDLNSIYLESTNHLSNSIDLESTSVLRNSIYLESVNDLRNSIYLESRNDLRNSLYLECTNDLSNSIDLESRNDLRNSIDSESRNDLRNSTDLESRNELSNLIYSERSNDRNSNYKETTYKDEASFQFTTTASSRQNLLAIEINETFDLHGFSESDKNQNSLSLNESSQITPSINRIDENVIENSLSTKEKFEDYSQDCDFKHLPLVVHPPQEINITPSIIKKLKKETIQPFIQTIMMIYLGSQSKLHFTIHSNILKVYKHLKPYIFPKRSRKKSLTWSDLNCFDFTEMFNPVYSLELKVIKNMLEIKLKGRFNDQSLKNVFRGIVLEIFIIWIHVLRKEKRFDHFVFNCKDVRDRRGFFDEDMGEIYEMENRDGEGRYLMDYQEFY